jgi:hypothetical protein
VAAAEVPRREEEDARLTAAAVSIWTLVRVPNSASAMASSVIPAPVLKQLGIRPLRKHALELADGTTITRQKGGALFKGRDDIGAADVILGENDDATLRGAFSLDALGLALDPIRRTLTPAKRFM